MPSTLYRATEFQYRELLPGFLAFDCKPLRATISPASCAGNWTSGREGSSCRGCRIGAIHAGRPEAPPPPPKPACCRCGRREQRLLAGTICVSCFNRTREVLKGRNAKSKPPVKAGEVLRWGFAILSHPDVAAALSKMRARHRTTGLWTAGPKSSYLPGLPKVEQLDAGHLWISVVVAGQDELTRIVERLIPGAAVVEAEFSSTFAEKWNLNLTPPP